MHLLINWSVQITAMDYCTTSSTLKRGPRWRTENIHRGLNMCKHQRDKYQHTHCACACMLSSLGTVPKEFLKHENTSTWHEIMSLYCSRQHWRHAENAYWGTLSSRHKICLYIRPGYANSACWVTHVSYKVYGSKTVLVIYHEHDIQSTLKSSCNG